MSQLKVSSSGERVLDAMIELARCSKRQRILLAGSNGPRRLFDLNRRGFNRAATTAVCGLPCGQYNAGLVEWQGSSIKALGATLDWFVHFLAPQGALAIWIEGCALADHRRLVVMLERLGFLIEVGTRCETGFAVCARRREMSDMAKAA
jgi:hypothetical protein